MNDIDITQMVKLWDELPQRGREMVIDAFMVASMVNKPEWKEKASLRRQEAETRLKEVRKASEGYLSTIEAIYPRLYSLMPTKQDKRLLADYELLIVFNCLAKYAPHHMQKGSKSRQAADSVARKVKRLLRADPDGHQPTGNDSHRLFEHGHQRPAAVLEGKAGESRVDPDGHQATGAPILEGERGDK